MPKTVNSIFVILANNGQVLATSETYKTKQGCHQAIGSVYTIQGNVYSRQQTVDATTSAGKPDKPEPQRPIGPAYEKPQTQAKKKKSAPPAPKDDE